MNKILSSALVLGLFVASASGAFAKGPGGAAPGGSPGASSFSPGHEARSGSSTVTPVPGREGASGYAPGQLNRANAPTTGTSPGASVYAPGFLK